MVSICKCSATCVFLREMSQASSTSIPRLESFFKRLPAGTCTSCTAHPSSKPGSPSAPVRRMKWPVGRKRPVGRPKKEPAEPEIIVLDSSNSEESELEELSGAGIPAAATPSKRRCVHRMYTHGQKKKVADYRHAIMVSAQPVDVTVYTTRISNVGRKSELRRSRIL